MKRIALQLDLKENEVLEAEILEAVRGYAKQVAREEFDHAIRHEVDRLVDKHLNDLKDNKYSRNSQLEKMAIDTINEKVRHAISGVAVLPDHILQRVGKIGDGLEERVDMLIAKELRDFNLDAYIEKRVQEGITAKVPQAVLDLMIAGVQRQSVNDKYNHNDNDEVDYYDFHSGDFVK